MSSDAAVPCRTLGEYVALLVGTLRQADPGRFRQLREVVGGRRALIAVDREAVVVGFDGDDLWVASPGPGVGWTGAGWTTRVAVLEMLDGYLEVGEAVAGGRLDIVGTPSDVTAMLRAIEILLDATPHTPALVEVAKAYRRDPCLAPRTQPPPPRPCPPDYPFSPSPAEEVLLRRLGLLDGPAPGDSSVPGGGLVPLWLCGDPPSPQRPMSDDGTSTPAPAPEAAPSTPAPDAPTPPPAPARPGLLERLPGWTVPALLVGVPLLFALVAKLSPGFYDEVVWRYYWGPIKADAEGAATLFHNGIPAHSGYNLVNTASWAVLLAVCLLGIAQLLQRTRTPMDGKLIVGATGWVVAGSVFHVMEDTGLFRTPLQYFFITPPIYLLFAAGGVASLAIGHYLRGVEARAGLDRALQKLWFILAIPVLVYLAMWLKPWDQVTHYVNPVWVALFALAAYVVAVWRFRRIGRIDPSELVSILSIGWILLSVAYTLSFVQAPWHPQTPVLAALWAPVLAALVAALMFGLALFMVGRAERRGKAKRRDFWFAFFNPINLLLLFSQMLDGIATAIGIDLGPYGEKHVLSKALIDVARDVGESQGIDLLAKYPTFFGFTTVKFAISLLVISAIDNSREGDKESPLIGLVKFAIIMVGIGPGIRDFVRMALGV